MTSIGINVDEAMIDVLLAEEFYSNSAFAAWFLEQCASNDISTQAYVLTSIQRSVSNRDGESDLIAIYGREQETFALLIENKIGAAFQDEQDDRYHRRGQDGVGAASWQSYRTVLIAPQKYLRDTGSKSFDVLISYESVLEHLPESTGSDRLNFKRYLLLEAIKKAKAPWERTVSDWVTEFFRKLRKTALAEFPDLPYPSEDDGRAPSSTWVIIGIEGIPGSRACIECKPMNAIVDLRMWGETERSIREGLSAVHWPPGLDTSAASRSASLRLRSAKKVDVNKTFEEQGDAIRAVLTDTSLMYRFAIEQREQLKRILYHSGSRASP